MRPRYRNASTASPKAAAEEPMRLISFTCALLADNPRAAATSISCPASSRAEAALLALKARELARERSLIAVVSVAARRVRVRFARSAAAASPQHDR